MRLSAFIVSEPNAQLLIDMTKLYLPYCSNEKKIEASYNDILSNESQQLFVASFNERHIAAACVEQIEHSLKLTNFAVRDITQQRGIGKFLLNESKKLATEKGCNKIIVVHQTAAEESLEQFLISQGLTRTDLGFELTL